MHLWTISCDFCMKRGRCQWSGINLFLSSYKGNMRHPICLSLVQAKTSRYFVTAQESITEVELPLGIESSIWYSMISYGRLCLIICPPCNLFQWVLYCSILVALQSHYPKSGYDDLYPRCWLSVTTSWLLVEFLDLSQTFDDHNDGLQCPC